MTPEEMAALAAAGRFWWARVDGTLYATAEHEPESESDHYLLNAYPSWVAQWESWEQAAEAMAPMLARIQELRN